MVVCTVSLLYPSFSVMLGWKTGKSVVSEYVLTTLSHVEIDGHSSGTRKEVLY